jgi:hypothetical protein
MTVLGAESEKNHGELPMTTIDINTLPRIQLDLSKMKNACEIKNIMKKLAIKDYCYAFMHNNIVMKFGQSSDKDWMRGSYGERIYRQSRFIPGWPTLAAAGSAGYDMEALAEKFPNINKNDVSIQVWDMTSVTFSVATDHRYELTIVENELIAMHIKAFGHQPLGNVKDQSYINKQSRVTDQMFNSLFDVVDN